MRAIAAALILGAAFVAGCGGDDDGGDQAVAPPPPTPATTEAAAATTVETTAAATVPEQTTTTVETTTTNAPTTTTTVPVTTTTIDPLTLSQGAYFVLSGNRNQAASDLFDRYRQGDGVPWAVYADYCREAAAIEEQWIEDLQNVEWIPSAQQAVDDLVAHSVTIVGQYYQCANTTGDQALADIDFVIGQTSQEAGAAASALRFALDLPIER